MLEFENINETWSRADTQMSFAEGKVYQLQNVGSAPIILREQAETPELSKPGILLNRGQFIDYKLSADPLWVRSCGISTLVGWEKRDA